MVTAASRFETYQVKRNDDLGDPDYWNSRFQDIDLRLQAREQDADRLDGAIDDLNDVGLARLNETFTPLIEAAEDRLTNIGAAFNATSSDEKTIGTGPLTFLLTEETRQAFVVTDYIAARPVGESDKSMICLVDRYERESGLLYVESVLAVGSGTFDNWDIRISSPPDVEHSTRTDNPHNVTKAQVGLGNANNTSDANKPVSIAQAAAIAAVAADVASLETDMDTADAALQADINLRAPLSSPAFTGNPTAPTQAAGNNSTRLANTSWVKARIAEEITDLIGSAPGALDSLAELAAAMNDDPAFAANIIARMVAAEEALNARIGDIVLHMGSGLPSGTLAADGSAISYATYSELGAVIYCGNGNNATADWGYRTNSSSNPSNNRSTSGTYIVLPDAEDLFPRALGSGRSLWDYQDEEVGSHDHGVWTLSTRSNGSPGSNTILLRGNASSGTASTYPISAPDNDGSENRPANFAFKACIIYEPVGP